MRTISQIASLFEDYAGSVRLGEEPESLYAPAHYIMEQGGKRMRPVALLCAHYLYSDTIELALPAALGVEVFHNFTLIHDDIMDEAATRRGMPSVHNKFGSNTAILAGDAMLIRSFDLVLKSAPDDRIREVMELMSESAIRICEGQQLDMDFEELLVVSTDDYIRMNTLKTAVLLGTCLQLGAMIAGADIPQAEQIYDAGVEIGRAFQIQDDILDAFGAEGSTGKKRGGDIINSKKTFLYSALIESLAPSKRQTFIELYNSTPGNPEVKIQQVLKWFEDFGIKNVAEDRLTEFYDKGIGLLEGLDAPEARKLTLLDLIGSLRKRIS